MSGRTIVIGDVHGCPDELDELHRACGVGPDDGLVFVGDLVGKGPDSHGVLERVRAWGARSVRGNHDEAALRKRALSPQDPRAHRARALLQRLTPDDFSLLQGLPLWLRVQDVGGEDVIVVHAGIVPGVPLPEQDPYLLMNMRTLDDHGRGHRAHDAGRLWGSVYPGPELILFGHHARAGLQQHAHAIGLDTGCVYGGRLTACVLPERRFVSVPARRAYAATSDGAGA